MKVSYSILYPSVVFLVILFAVCSCGNNVMSPTAKITTVTTNYPSYQRQWSETAGYYGDLSSIAIFSQYAYVLDTTKNRVYKYNTNGTWLAQFGSSEISGGKCLSVDNNGYIYVSGYTTSKIWKYDASGVFQREYTYGGGSYFFQDVAIHSDCNSVLSALPLLDYKIARISNDNSYATYVSYTPTTQVYALTIDDEDNIYISFSSFDPTLVKMTPNGAQLWKKKSSDYPTAYPGFQTLHFGKKSKYIYATSMVANDETVYILNKAGVALCYTWGTSGTANGQFSNCSGVAEDDYGNIYVVDPGNFRVQVFSPYSIITNVK